MRCDLCSLHALAPNERDAQWAIQKVDLRTGFSLTEGSQRLKTECAATHADLVK